jgi:hypothetical protein
VRTARQPVGNFRPTFIFPQFIEIRQMGSIAEEFVPEYVERAPECMRCAVSRRFRKWTSAAAIVMFLWATVCFSIGALLSRSKTETAGYLSAAGLVVAALATSSCCGLKYCCRQRDADGYDQLAVTSDDEAAVLM